MDSVASLNSAGNTARKGASKVGSCSEVPCFVLCPPCKSSCAAHAHCLVGQNQINEEQWYIKGAAIQRKCSSVGVMRGTVRRQTHRKRYASSSGTGTNKPANAQVEGG